MLELDSLRLGLAFSAGVATFFAPCAFPLLPGYVAYYLGHGAGDATPSSRPTRVRRAAGSRTRGLGPEGLGPQAARVDDLVMLDRRGPMDSPALDLDFDDVTIR